MCICQQIWFVSAFVPTHAFLFVCKLNQENSTPHSCLLENHILTMILETTLTKCMFPQMLNSAFGHEIVQNVINLNILFLCS